MAISLFREHISESHLIQKHWNTALILKQGFFLGNKLLWNQSAKMQKKEAKNFKVIEKRARVEAYFLKKCWELPLWKLAYKKAAAC